MEEDYLGNSLPNILKKIIIIIRYCTKTYLMKILMLVYPIFLFYVMSVFKFKILLQVVGIFLK